MIIKPKVRAFICVTAHPEGCAAHVQQQIDRVISQQPFEDGPKKVLVIGASTGYGLASRITAAFGYGADTLGVFFERPSQKGKPASPGWYNTVAFEQAAKKEDLYAASINGDAFSDEIKQQTVEKIKADLGEVDLVVYSLASPRRTDPETGRTHKSVLKPIDQTYRQKNLDTDRKEINEVMIEPATDEEIEDTIKVMGGEDWERWMKALKDGGVLAKGANAVAYSYIGPEVTWPIYKNGTIGKAKEDLERAAAAIDRDLKETGGFAVVSVNKAIVSQASSAIPVVPLYISLLFDIMKARGTHEDCIEQMCRLFKDRLFAEGPLEVDEGGRVRVDDWEMDPDVQAEVANRWHRVSNDNLDELADFAGYQENFLRLFGFGLPGVDYDADVDPERDIPSLKGE
ncbi:MAG: enoyl-ACP reductase FabV [Opitutales bacterium]